MAALALTPQLFVVLSAFIEDRLGIHYRLDERELLEQKLSEPALEAGFDSLLDYYYHLRYDDPAGRAFDALVDALVVGETYFFRELPQLEALVEHAIAPAARAARPGGVRVWSAACASGEEPLSLAMLLERRGLLQRCELVASDVSLRALARAQRGTYPARSVRSPEAAELARPWLTRVGERWAVTPRLRERIAFRRVNLAVSAEIAALGQFDAILCRNALIYFDDARAARVVRDLAAALRPGGALVVGVSESLHRLGAPLALEQAGELFLYRRAGERPLRASA